MQRGKEREGRRHGAQLNNGVRRTERRRHRTVETLVEKKKNHLIHYTLTDNTPLNNDTHWTNSHLTADAQNSPRALTPSKSVFVGKNAQITPRQHTPVTPSHSALLS